MERDPSIGRPDPSTENERRQRLAEQQLDNPELTPDQKDKILGNMSEYPDEVEDASQ